MHKSNVKYLRDKISAKIRCSVVLFRDFGEIVLIDLSLT